MFKSIYYCPILLLLLVEAAHQDNWHPVLAPELYEGIKTVQTHVTHPFHQSTSSSIDGQPKAIASWISNTERSSYFSLSVEGHTFYRLNYPLRLNKWYHTCQSWNGKTGEWQIWVNGERVGRGFHNRLVSHIIPSGGLAITGQQQSQLGGGFLEGDQAPKGAGGMLGEITMVQLYSVALTAGKAHRDHKHHHAHQYDHNGNQITTPPPQTPRPRTPLPAHPLLTGGQINPMLRLNFAGGQPGQQQPQIIPGQSYNAQFLNGQFVGGLVTQQLSQGRGPQQFQPQQLQFLTSAPQPQPQQLQFLGSGSSQRAPTPLVGSGLVHPSLVNPANVQIIDTQLDAHQLFKRQNGEEKEESELKFGDKIVKKTKRQSEDHKAENKHKKRELYLSGGTIIEDGYPGSSGIDQSFLDGLAGIGENKPILQEQKQNDEREPAEAEVKAVMNVCSGCDEEPFEKALVFGWRTVPKKLYSGAFYTPAVPQCKAF
ncbi:uncharacterized protein BDFB_004173 [Asbolus verrucosus]|uniref:Pentraxin (PTX) domain-containing protein n=1 Tax=Asbolus verrucosus TaxID=1661398 RepID=A0A482VM36_ASBVE|nr:uncharacterized protein BDFB_004173 [Asbolus verrucosus]